MNAGEMNEKPLSSRMQTAQRHTTLHGIKGMKVIMCSYKAKVINKGNSGFEVKWAASYENTMQPEEKERKGKKNLKMKETSSPQNLARKVSRK